MNYTPVVILIMADASFIDIMIRFKTNKCSVVHSPDKYDLCPFYHDDSDFRRNPIAFDGINLTYHNSLFFPKLQADTQRSYYCQNIVEYNYHPLNYKLRHCPRLEIENHCELNKCCPYLHPDDNKETFQHYIKQLRPCEITLEFKADKSITQSVIGSKEDPYLHSLPNGEQAYIFKSRVGFEEDATHEFKAWTLTKNFEWLINSLEEYVCAFANSCGGIIYIGITDDGHVTGTVCSREIMDKLKLAIDNMVKLI